MSGPSQLREDAQRLHPDFPWLDLDRPETVRNFLVRGGWLESGETFRGCERAGDGNMNLTLRVRTDQRRFVLKQARPWVEKYDEIEAPWDRSLFEHRFYERVAGLRDVASRMPRLLGADRAARVILLEDLPGARDFTDLYAGDASTRVPPSDDEIADLADYLRALHAGTFGEPDPDLANREMRDLNHAHIFEIPLSGEAGVDLDALEPGLAGAAADLARDTAYRAAVEQTGRRYLADGPCLVHGDYFPGSWLRTDVGVRIIDPEFAFFGDAELDLGCAAAHMALSGVPVLQTRRLLEAYAKNRDAVSLDPERLARYAAVEVMRRLIGVAQLPIPPSEGRRRALLERSRRALLEAELDRLWSPETEAG